MTKYSQPLALVLFHVIKTNIKCHKCYHYSHLLNNYLFNYLNVLGLTESEDESTQLVNSISFPSFVHFLSKFARILGLLN